MPDETLDEQIARTKKEIEGVAKEKELLELKMKLEKTRKEISDDPNLTPLGNFTKKLITGAFFKKKSNH